MESVGGSNRDCENPQVFEVDVKEDIDDILSVRCYMNMKNGIPIEKSNRVFRINREDNSFKFGSNMSLAIIDYIDRGDYRTKSDVKGYMSTLLAFCNSIGKYKEWEKIVKGKLKQYAKKRGPYKKEKK